MLNNVKIPKAILNSAINHMAMESWIHFGDLKARPELIKPLINELVEQLGERLDERAESFWSNFKNSISYLRRQLSSHPLALTLHKEKGEEYTSFFFSKEQFNLRRQRILKIPGVSRLGTFPKIFPEFSILKNVFKNFFFNIFPIIEQN